MERTVIAAPRGLDHTILRVLCLLGVGLSAIIYADYLQQVRRRWRM